MKKIQFFIMLVLGNCLVYSQTVNETERNILNKIKSGNAQYESMACHFKQTKHTSRKKEVVSDGSFYYKKPDRMLMSFQQPAGDIMLINKDRYVMAIAGKQRETTSANTRMKGFNDILTACFEGDLMAMGAERLFCSETSQRYTITANINPKQNKSNIVKVIANYDKNDSSILSIKMIEKGDNYTVYEFSNKNFNSPINESVFNVPKKGK